MSGITEYRDGFINQLSYPGSTFGIQGNVTSANTNTIVKDNLTNIIFNKNASITFVNQSDRLQNICRMYWTYLGNNIEYDLISQKFDNDIVVSKQLRCELSSANVSNTTVLDVMTDHDGNPSAPIDYRFGEENVHYDSNAVTPISSVSISLPDPSSTFAITKPEFFTNNNILPYFEGLEMNILKLGSSNRLVGSYFTNSNRGQPSNPMQFKSLQMLKAKIIKSGTNTYHWHVFETKTPV